MPQQNEQLLQVLEISINAMNSLYRQLAGSSHAVLLTDASGMILNCIRKSAKKHSFEQVDLLLGADWSDACEGSYGIDTYLALPITHKANWTSSAAIQ
jgi:transcriptional regulator of acetoin/glycerol metabolism